MEVVQKLVNLKEMSANYRNTDEMRICALTRILTMMSVMKANHLSTNKLFNASSSGTLYVSVMSSDRFSFLLKGLTIDEKSIRSTFGQGNVGCLELKERTKRIHETNRNITCDNWFTFLPPTKSLLKTSYNVYLQTNLSGNCQIIQKRNSKMGKELTFTAGEYFILMGI